MQQSDDLSSLEIVEMFAGLSCFLKDSSDVSQTLLDDFRMCQGYTFLCDLMLRYSLGLPSCSSSQGFKVQLERLVTPGMNYPVSAKVAAGGCCLKSVAQRVLDRNRPCDFFVC